MIMSLRNGALIPVPLRISQTADVYNSVVKYVTLM